MSEANKLLLKRWFEQVWNQKSEAAIDEMFNQKASLTAFPMLIRFWSGPKPLRLSIALSVGAFPDLHVDIKR